MNEIKYNEDPEKLLRAEKAAEFLGVTTRTLQAWRSSKKGPEFVRISSRGIRYKRSALMEFVKSRG